MSADNDDIKVEYTVKELLASIKTEQTAWFARVEEAMKGKADKADLAAINARLDEHGREIGRLKDRQREDEVAQKALEAARSSSRSLRQWSVSTWVAIGGVCSSAGFLVYTVVHG